MPSSTSPLSPAVGHVILVVHQLPGTTLRDSLYLEVPIDIATAICYVGTKYLAYLGFVVLNHVGWISKIAGGTSVDSSEPFEGIFYFVVPYRTDAELSHYIVNTECIRLKSGESQALKRNTDFPVEVNKRDVVCPFTRHAARFCQAAHTFPHARGSNWFHDMVKNRRSDKFGAEFSELDPDDLQDIDDVRNGILLYRSLHTESESRLAAILKTPNPALQTDDVIEDSTAASNARTCTSSISLQYPANARYTFTWLVRQEDLQKIYGDRLDGMFGSIDEATLPSALILHYVYGATALERWGRNAAEFMKSGRTLVRVNADARPKESHNRNIAIGKRNRAVEDVGREGPDVGGEGSSNAGSAEADDIPIADQLMMMLAYKSPEKRKAREEADRSWQDRMHGWRQDTDLALHPLDV